MINSGREWDWMQQLQLEEKLKKKTALIVGVKTEGTITVDVDGYKVMTDFVFTCDTCSCDKKSKCCKKFKKKGVHCKKCPKI